MANENNPGSVRQCPNDCRQCGFHQHAFCAAQMGYSTLSLLQQMSSRLQEIEKFLAELADTTGDLIDPTAQEGSGADE